jgi:hypothetical protein
MLKQVKRINFSAKDEESGATYELIAEGDAEGEVPTEGEVFSGSIQTSSGQDVRSIAKGKYQIEGVFGPVELVSDDPNAP